MNHRYDTRSREARELEVIVSATGGTTKFPHQDMVFRAKSGNTTTALACPAWTALPVGLRFIIDNSITGATDFTVTPTTGTAIVANAGEVWACEIVALGVPYFSQLTPTFPS